MNETTSRRCFAASNSCRGFCNYYGEIFTEARAPRLYVIKGGPGTGKSHFMKTVAGRARREGCAVTEYACSSDPASLDGILIERAGHPAMGLLDGTPPHVCEPALPGAREEIINLGAFWDARRLVGQRDTIERLNREKAEAYAHAYAYLAAVGQVDGVADARLESCVNREGLLALGRRILRGQPVGKGFTPIPALRRAVSMRGAVCLHAFEQESAALGGTLLLPEDHYGLGYRLTALLLGLSREAGHRVLVSYDPVLPHKIDGLLYPDTGLCILVGQAEPIEGAATRALSLRRYTDAAALRGMRGELRHIRALGDSLTEAALRALSVAAEAHGTLESIYAAAMDFRAKEAFTEAFCDGLFGE